MMPWDDPEYAIKLIEQIAAFGVCVASLEWLLYRHQLDDSGLLSWSSLQLRHPVFAAGPLAALLNPIFSYPLVLVLFAARLGAALLLLVIPSNETARTFLVVFIAI